VQINIPLPNIQEQRRIALERYTVEQIAKLSENAKAPAPDVELTIDENEFSTDHMLSRAQGWVAPAPEVVRAYFDQFQTAFPDYKTDKKLGELLGERHDRRIRAFKSGDQKVPYALWQRFLVMTGRVRQEIIPVYGIMK
jgi:formylglycine-generating enzyme required for sulfatase activity